MPLRSDPLPRTAGILTFVRAPASTTADLEEGHVAVAGVPYDMSTTSRIGARFGPGAYRETSNYYAPHMESRDSGAVEINSRERVSPERVRESLRDLGDFTVYAIEWDKNRASLRESMYQIARTGALPVIMGGDHFITFPLMQGFKDAVLERGGSKIGYIQFSSQLDLGDEDPAWGRVWRGATARRILDGGMAEARNMVWVGTNGYIRSEQWEMARERGLNVFTLADVRSQGIEAVARQAAEIAGDGCDSIYLSVDLDVLDGGYVAGTAAPSFDGMRNIDLWEAMDVLTHCNVGALDLCGLNPNIEIDGLGKTGQRFGVHLILRFIYPRIMGTA